MKHIETEIRASSYPVSELAVNGSGPISAAGITTVRKDHKDIPGNRTNGRILLTPSVLENKLLSSLDRSSLINLLPYIERVTVTSEEYLFFPGKNIQYIYFPESAVVSEVQILEDGRTVEIAMTGRESAIGLPSIYGHRGASTWLQATTKGSVLRIGIEVLREELGRNEAFQKVCFEHINDHIRQLSKRIACHNYHSIEQRLCTWLLMLHDRKREGSLSLTHEKMARLLGVHRPSITVIAKTLRSAKAVNYFRGRLFITNRRTLESYACSCYSDGN